jgi:hypothetical protein
MALNDAILLQAACFHVRVRIVELEVSNMF